MQRQKAGKVSKERKRNGCLPRSDFQETTGELIWDNSRRTGWRKKGGRNGEDEMNFQPISASTKTAQLANKEQNLKNKSLQQREDVLHSWEAGSSHLVASTYAQDGGKNQKSMEQNQGDALNKHSGKQRISLLKFQGNAVPYPHHQFVWRRRRKKAWLNTSSQ